MTEGRNLYVAGLRTVLSATEHCMLRCRLIGGGSCERTSGCSDMRSHEGRRKLEIRTSTTKAFLLLHMHWGWLVGNELPEDGQRGALLQGNVARDLPMRSRPLPAGTSSR